MKTYLKMAITPFIYIVFAAMLGVGVILIDKNLIALQYVLCSVNLAFYVVVVGFAGIRDGQKAIKVRAQNDLFRRKIVETGEDLPLKLSEEFKKWKGYVIGAIACIPSVIFVIIHVVVNLSNPAVMNNAFGMIGGLFSILTFSFVLVTESVTTWEYLLILLIIPFVSGVYGSAYLIGGNKEQKNYDKIAEVQKQLHGDEK